MINSKNLSFLTDFIIFVSVLMIKMHMMLYYADQFSLEDLFSSILICDVNFVYCVYFSVLQSTQFTESSLWDIYCHLVLKYFITSKCFDSKSFV